MESVDGCCALEEQRAEQGGRHTDSHAEEGDMYEIKDGGRYVCLLGI